MNFRRRFNEVPTVEILSQEFTTIADIEIVEVTESHFDYSVRAKNRRRSMEFDVVEFDWEAHNG